MTMYSVFTMIYLAVIVTTVFVWVQNKKYKGYSIFGMKFEKLLLLSIASTMLFSFMTAYSMESMSFLWSNFTFVMCAIGVIIFTAVGLTGINIAKSDTQNIDAIDKQIKSIDDKKAKLDERISDMKRYISSLATPEEREAESAALNELITLRKKYKSVRQDLIHQKSMFEAKIENENLDKIRLTSSKNAVNGIAYHKKRFRNNRKLDNGLSDVSNIISKY